MRKTKAKLIMTLSVALLSVFTMGVSTFAWFQAQAEVNIRTESTSTTITVSKPDDYTFYYYNKNKLSTYGTPNGTFSNDFTAVTSGNVGTATGMAGMYPGQKMTFCVLQTAQTVGTSVIKLDLTKLKSNTTVTQGGGLLARKIRTGDYANYDFNIGWAMNIYATVIGSNAVDAETTLTGYSSFITSPTGDLFTFGPNNNATYIAGTVNDGVITLTTPISLVSSRTATHTKMFIFYTVEFSNASSTLYKEVNSSGGDIVTPPPSGIRYFDQSNTGSSNCYAGLTFQLNTLSLV